MLDRKLSIDKFTNQCYYCGVIIKIGVSKNPRRRLKVLEGANPRILEIIGYIGPIDSKKDALRLEYALHQRYKDNRITGEWFNLNRDDLPPAMIPEYPPIKGNGIYVYFISEGKLLTRKGGINLTLKNQCRPILPNYRI